VTIIFTSSSVGQNQSKLKSSLSNKLHTYVDRERKGIGSDFIIPIVITPCSLGAGELL
jgi:hypothetical protein